MRKSRPRSEARKKTGKRPTRAPVRETVEKTRHRRPRVAARRRHVERPNLGWVMTVAVTPLVIAWIVWKAAGLPRTAGTDAVPPPAAPPPVVVAPVSEPMGGHTPPPGDPQFSYLTGKPIGERIAYWSDLFHRARGTPESVAKIAGAPEIPDNAPLLPARYNCTTFVETVSALARARDPGEFYPNLLSIRYRGGTPTYLSRNHFPEADWMPNNANAGILEDVTARFAADAGVITQVASKEIRRAEWVAAEARSGRVDRSIASTGESEWKQPVQVNVTYVPLADIERVAARIPSGTVINLVRGNHPRQPVLITHQGFVIQQNGVTYFRHATPKGNIRSQELSQYLRALRDSGPRDWPVVGVSLAAINEPD
jgi:hypothetical protein